MSCSLHCNCTPLYKPMSSSYVPMYQYKSNAISEPASASTSNELSPGRPQRNIFDTSLFADCKFEVHVIGQAKYTIGITTVDFSATFCISRLLATCYTSQDSADVNVSLPKQTQHQRNTTPNAKTHTTKTCDQTMGPDQLRVESVAIGPSSHSSINSQAPLEASTEQMVCGFVLVISIIYLKIIFQA